MKNNIFKIFSNCIPIKGYRRSIILDVQRGDFKFIPNELYDILVNHEGSSLNFVKNKYTSGYQKIIDEYFDFLISNEFIFFCNKNEYDFFPDINNKWESPSLIANGIIELDANPFLFFENIITQLEKLICKHLLIIDYSPDRDLNFYKRIIEITKDKRLMSIDIVNTTYNNKINIDDFDNLINGFSRFNSILFYNTNQKSLNGKNNKKYFRNKEFIIEHIENEINPENFVKNISFYLEALSYNTYYNRKVCIDIEGRIKNAPNLKNNYGNILGNSIAEIIKKEKFNELWEVNKRQDISL